MMNELRDVTGFRGEKIVELCLSDYSEFPVPLFRPGFLGEKWPAIDFYVELTSVPGKRLYFFGQTKTTKSALNPPTKSLAISTTKADIDRLLRIPGPTYLFGVHEPSMKVNLRSVHKGTPSKAITRIPLSYELTGANLKKLHEEVRSFWATIEFKPTKSVFS